jgi:GT2 family glycosyltransferase
MSIVPDWPPVTIIVPVYGNPGVLQACLASCREHVDHRHRILVIDDAGPDGAEVERVARGELTGHPGFRFERQPHNFGFVRTCNRAAQEIDRTDNDILLLNSDTVVTEGFLEEMQAVLDACERHGACCPRSDHATILSVPGPDAYARWQALRERLPRWSVMPTGVGFCMLIRRSMIRQYGLFDEIYGRGYSEENDFCCRINRHGYSTVAANHAFVYHAQHGSFKAEDKAMQEASNAPQLQSRYPEYWPSVRDYLRWYRGAAEHFAEHLGLPAARPAVAIDVSRAHRADEGASCYAREIERTLPQHLAPWADATVIADAGARTRSFDLVFVPHPVLRLDHFAFINRLAPRIAVSVHDEACVRSNRLRTPEREHAFRLALRHADTVIATGVEPLRQIDAYAASAGIALREAHVIVPGGDDFLRQTSEVLRGLALRPVASKLEERFAACEAVEVALSAYLHAEDGGAASRSWARAKRWMVKRLVGRGET